MLLSLLGVAMGSQSSFATPNRFDLTAPFPGLPAVRIDKIAAGVGVAQQMARAKGWQARVLWVDATANLGSTNSEEKIIALVDRAKRLGFNTLCVDIKPIIGYTLYPSQYASQLGSWRTNRLEPGFDPVPIFLRAAHARGLKLFVCMNAFSEGHQIARNQPGKEFADGRGGPGYDMPEMQSVQYRPAPHVRVGGWDLKLAPALNSTAGGNAGLFDRTPPAGSVAFLVDVGRRLGTYSGAALKPGERVLVVTGPMSGAAPLGEVVSLTAEARFLKSSEEQNQVPLMMNPHDPKMVARTMDFAREVLAKYPVDGLLYDDRLRFTGGDADFSELTRRQFESLVGEKLNWPTDVFEATYNWDLGKGIRPGKYWDAWWAFRAHAMNQWVGQIRGIVDQHNRSTKSPALFGLYAGSWYGEYDNYGANYGSAEAAAGFPFLTRSFRREAFASKLDLMITGCYYKTATIFESMVAGLPEGRAVEAAGIMTNRIVNDDCWAVAGISLETFDAEPALVQGALQAAAATTQGVMVFDNSHKIEKFEPYLSRAFAKPATPPYANSSWLAEVRRMKRAREAQGAKPPPIFIYPGAPGAGH